MDKHLFDNFGKEEWVQYYDALNSEMSAENCGLDLTDGQKEAYNKALRSLQEDRAKYPNIPIFYEISLCDFD